MLAETAVSDLRRAMGNMREDNVRINELLGEFGKLTALSELARQLTRLRLGWHLARHEEP